MRAGVHTGLVVVAEVRDQTARGARLDRRRRPNLAARSRANGAGHGGDQRRHPAASGPDFHLQIARAAPIEGVVRRWSCSRAGPVPSGARLTWIASVERAAGWPGPAPALGRSVERSAPAADSSSRWGTGGPHRWRGGDRRVTVAADIRQRVARSGWTLEAGCLAATPTSAVAGCRLMSGSSTAACRPIFFQVWSDISKCSDDVAEVAPLVAPLSGIAQPEGYPAPELEPTALLDRTWTA